MPRSLAAFAARPRQGFGRRPAPHTKHSLSELRGERWLPVRPVKGALSDARGRQRGSARRDPRDPIHHCEGPGWPLSPARRQRRARPRPAWRTLGSGTGPRPAQGRALTSGACRRIERSRIAALTASRAQLVGEAAPEGGSSIVGPRRHRLGEQHACRGPCRAIARAVWVNWQNSRGRGRRRRACRQDRPCFRSRPRVSFVRSPPWRPAPPVLQAPSRGCDRAESVISPNSARHALQAPVAEVRSANLPRGFGVDHRRHF